MFYVHLTFVCGTCKAEVTKRVMLKIDGTPDLRDVPDRWLLREYNGYAVPYCPEHAIRAE